MGDAGTDRGNTGVAPRGQIWLVPGQVLMQLILGLNSLIATSRLVVQHEYRIVKR
jgi:hypothetical protein